MKPSVYLAGPISGCTYGECTDWRLDAKTRFADQGIDAFSPMRAKHYLASLADRISATGVEYKDMGVLSQARGVMTRDRFDCTRPGRHAVLANLLGADRVSVGTVMEIAWADLLRIPVVAVMEPTGNPHEHMMVNEAIGFRVRTLDEAIYICSTILLP